jgi:phosphotransferase system HPr (HPr) family protein
MEFFVKIIKESEFVPLADKASVTLLTFASHCEASSECKFSKRLYVALVKESMELEDFLDDHGARGNKTWVFFGELVASIRNIASTAYIISHILGRIKFYKLANPQIASFLDDSNACLAFLNATLSSLFSRLKKEARTLHLSLPPACIDENDFEDTMVVKVLPQNINEQEMTQIHENITRVAAEFIDAHNDSQVVLIEKKLPSRMLDSGIIPNQINEETLRHLETHVHNSQSMYDTYIQKTPCESENAMLNTLRGHISITLHLLGAAKSLCHFFERHETSVRNEINRKKIEKIVNRKKILDAIINYSLYYYTLFVKDGVTIAEKILAVYTIVDEQNVPVPDGLGFHLRPSTLVAKIVNHHGKPVTMIVNGKEFDAGSVIDIMWAGGMIKKEGITHIAFRGDENAIHDLQLLSQANYGEDTMGTSTPLPDALSYLRQD